MGSDEKKRYDELVGVLRELEGRLVERLDAAARAGYEQGLEAAAAFVKRTRGCNTGPAAKMGPDALEKQANDIADELSAMAKAKT